MSKEAIQAPVSSDFKILCHHIYEYHKGLRSLVLHTMNETWWNARLPYAISVSVYSPWATTA